MDLILLGAVTLACFLISLFFLRFWKTTGDRFLLFFSISFFIQGLGRLPQMRPEFSDEQEPFIYLVRLIAYLVILYAIIDKNWIRKQS